MCCLDDPPMCFRGTNTLSKEGRISLVIHKLSRLNMVTIKNKYHMPNVEKFFNYLRGASNFSKIKLKASTMSINLEGR